MRGGIVLGLDDSLDWASGANVSITPLTLCTPGTRATTASNDDGSGSRAPSASTFDESTTASMSPSTKLGAATCTWCECGADGLLRAATTTAPITTTAVATAATLVSARPTRT